MLISKNDMLPPLPDRVLLAPDTAQMEGRGFIPHADIGAVLRRDVPNVAGLERVDFLTLAGRPFLFIRRTCDNYVTLARYAGDGCPPQFGLAGR